MTDQLASPSPSRRYQILSELGTGAMGIVYRAFDHLLGREVALKRLLTLDQAPSGTTDRSTTGIREALAQEFKVLATLRHPNIISVLDFGFDQQGLPYISMEVLDKSETFVAAGADQPSDMQVNMIVQLLQALMYLHRRGVLHRDLKPNNVLVQQGHVKVLDFGLALTNEDERPTDGEIAGTIAYLAPEALQGGPPSESSDLYAVGVMAYELFAKQYPFPTQDFVTLITDIMHTMPNVWSLPVEEQLQAVIARLLSKTPDERYKSAQDVLQALREFNPQLVAQPAASRDSFLLAARFTGRQAELDQLHVLLEGLLEQRGALCLIGGESGVGKSRLVEEIRTRALVKGVVVVSGQSVVNSSIPYQPWRDVLRWLLLLVDVNPFEASVLKPLVADISKILDRPVDDPPAIDPRGIPERLFGVISEMFQRLNRPMMIVLEDLQWAGSESLTLLARLAPLLPTRPILFLGTYRDEEAPQLPAQFANPHTIRLKRLSSHEIGELSQSMLGTAGKRPAVLEVLQRESEGNVFFLVEIVRVLVEEAGDLELIGLDTLPAQVFADGMKQIVLRRLEHVPDNLKILVNLAAVSGRILMLPVLRQILPHIDLDLALTICSDAAIFEVFEDQWRFTHDKLREGTTDLLSADEKRDLHRQVAEGLEALYKDAPDQSSLLAYHWGKAENKERELHYSGIAAEHLLKNGAYREALSYSQRALDLIAQQPDSPEILQQTLSLMLNHATLVLVIKGQGAPETKGAYDRARELANRMGETPQMFQVLFGLWAFYLFSGNLTTAREVSQQCLAMAEKFNISGMIMESHVALGNTDFWLGYLTEARDHLHQVISLYNPAEHDAHLHMFGQDARITARTYGAWSTWMLGYPDQALAHAHEAMRIARERNNLYLVVTAQQIVAWVHALRGEIPEVLETSGAMIEICQKENFPVFLAIGLMLHGWALAQSGETDIGVGEIRQGIQIWSLLGSQLATAPANWLAEVFIHADRWQEALEAAETGLVSAEGHHEDVFLSELLRFKALALFGLDRPQEAEDLLLKAYETATRQQAKSYQLRAALSLFSHTDNPVNRQRLQDVYDWFTEGQQTHDLQQVRQALS